MMNFEGVQDLGGASAQNETQAPEEKVVNLEEQKKSFEGYGVSQTALLTEAAVESRGSYVLYASGSHAQQWRKEFLELIK